MTVFSTCATTRLVRATEAPSGSCTAMKKAPWSSSGRKPVGVIADRPAMPTAHTAMTAIDQRCRDAQQPRAR